MLKYKTKQTMDLLLANPALRPYEAYMVTHPKAGKSTAQKYMSKLLSQTEVQLYIKSHIDLARAVNLEVLKNAKDRTDKLGYQRLASDVAERILDRELGKPVQRQEVKSMRISISLGSLDNSKLNRPPTPENSP